MRRITNVFSVNFALSSELTFGDNKLLLLDFVRILADRDLTAYLSHSHPDVVFFFLFVYNQLTPRPDKEKPTVKSRVEEDKGNLLFNVAL